MRSTTTFWGVDLIVCADLGGRVHPRLVPLANEIQEILQFRKCTVDGHAETLWRTTDIADVKRLGMTDGVGTSRDGSVCSVMRSECGVRS